jgi:hypothetical protein
VAKDNVHSGSLAYLKMIHTYVDCFTSTSKSYVQRVCDLGYVTAFVRYWNIWLESEGNKHGLSRGKNGLTVETCTDVEMSAAVAITMISVCADFPKFGRNFLDLSRLVCCPCSGSSLIHSYSRLVFCRCPTGRDLKLTRWCLVV